MSLDRDCRAAYIAMPSLAGWEGYRTGGAGLPEARALSWSSIFWLTAGAEDRSAARCPMRLVKGRVLGFGDQESAGRTGWRAIRYSRANPIPTSAYLACAKRMLAAQRRLVSACLPRTTRRPLPPCDPMPAAVAAKVPRTTNSSVCTEWVRHLYDRDYRQGLHLNVAGAGSMRRLAAHEELLPYLVRRLLENGANSSRSSIASTTMNPCLPSRTRRRSRRHRQGAFTSQAASAYCHNRPPSVRRDSARIPCRRQSSPTKQAELAFALELTSVNAADRKSWQASLPLVRRRRDKSRERAINVTNPADRQPDVIGRLAAAGRDARRRGRRRRWSMPRSCVQRLGSPRRSKAVAGKDPGICAADRDGRAAMPELMRLVRDLRSRQVTVRRRARRSARSGGLPVVTTRLQSRKLFAPSGKTDRARPASHNELQLHGRGVFVCISPWNFPLAIFMGQIAAALASGNTGDRQAGRADAI